MPTKSWGRVGTTGKVSMHGLKELNSALKQLPDKLQEKALKNAMAAGARVIRNEARERVPVGQGPRHLRDMIVVSKSLKRRGRRLNLRGYVVVGIKEEGRFYAHLVEFGSIHAAPHPFMRPAFDTKKEEALRIIGPKLGKEIEKQARKLSKRLSPNQVRRFAR